MIIWPPVLIKRNFCLAANFMLVICEFAFGVKTVSFGHGSHLEMLPST
jgi:hypothetical protein